MTNSVRDAQWQSDLEEAQRDRKLHLVLPMVSVWRFANKIQFLTIGAAIIIGYVIGSYVGAIIGFGTGFIIGTSCRLALIKFFGRLSRYWSDRPLSVKQEEKLVIRYRRNKKFEQLFFKHSLLLVISFALFCILLILLEFR